MVLLRQTGCRPNLDPLPTTACRPGAGPGSHLTTMHSMKAIAISLNVVCFIISVKSDFLPCFGFSSLNSLAQNSLANGRKHFGLYTCRMTTKSPSNVVVVGGGWAGLGAAYHLAGQGYNVTVLDAAPNAGGLAGGLKPGNGTTIELGMKGFWFQVGTVFARNIFFVSSCISPRVHLLLSLFLSLRHIP